MRNSKLHWGHRQRLKDKVRMASLEVLSPHEILELLLTYPIPYKDVNELAHELIHSYGSIHQVLGANRDDLTTFKGIGEEAALYLNVLYQLNEYINREKNQKAEKLATVKNCVDYFRNHYSIKDKEEVFLVFTDKQDNFVKTISLGEGENYSASICVEIISKQIASSGARNTILYHTHPHGSATPSPEDIKATSKIMSICNMMGVKFLDHIVLNKCESYSFRNSGILMELEVDVARKLSDFINDRI